jgi:hypothetical protein
MNVKEIIQSIDDLQGMLHKLDREGIEFLSDDAVNIITDDLVGFNCDDLEEILVHGCKGYANMTNIELLEEYKYTIREVEQDNANTIYNEVEEAIKQICFEQAEKALLES